MREMRSYIGYVLIDNEIKEIPFETDGNPVKYLWGRFGMSAHIERIEGVEDAGEETEEELVTSEEDEGPEADEGSAAE